MRDDGTLAKDRRQVGRSHLIQTRPFRAIVVPIVLLAAWPFSLSAQEARGTVIIRGGQADNVYVAGGTVDVLGDLEKDLVAAGGTVHVRALVKEDITAAGGSITLLGPVGDDVRAAGGTVTIEGDVGGDVVAAGGVITLAPGTRVGGRAWLAGRTVEVAGHITRELAVAAATVRLSGQVDGDVRLTAGTIEILPTARIHGALSYTSRRRAMIDPSAQILGTVTHIPSDVAARIGRVGRVVLRSVQALLLLGLIAAGLLWVLLFPHFATSAARTIHHELWISLGLGFALLVATPMAGVLAMMTLIGAPIGLAAFAVYAVSLLVGYLTAALFLADWGARRLRLGPGRAGGAGLAHYGLALGVLGLLCLIPVVGGAIALFAAVVGLGACTRQAYQRYTSGRVDALELPPRVGTWDLRH